jgi:hypothetical protein
LASTFVCLRSHRPCVDVELAHDPMALTNRARRIEVTLSWALSSTIWWIVTHITHQLCYNLIHGQYPGSPKLLVRGYWERARQHIDPSAGRGKATAEQCLSVASYHSIRRMVALSHPCCQSLSLRRPAVTRSDTRGDYGGQAGGGSVSRYQAPHVAHFQATCPGCQEPRPRRHLPPNPLASPRQTIFVGFS